MRLILFIFEALVEYYEAAGRDTGITSIVESFSICNTGTDTGKY